MSSEDLNFEPAGGATDVVPPAPITQLLIWTRLGMQSFGGGMATLSLIRRAFVDQYQFITAEEFTRYWALVLMVPGINLLGLTVLIGKKIDGARGIAVALIGLLFPSVTITIVLTALYSRVQHSHIIVSALSGVIPATVGIGMFTGGQIAQPILKKCLTTGRQSIGIALLLFIGSGLLEALVHWPVALILIACGTLGALTRFAGEPEIAANR